MSQAAVKKMSRWGIPIGIVVIAGLLITLIVLQMQSDAGPEDGAGPIAVETESPDLSFVETRDANDVQTAGPVDAPVALVVYSDYQCPFCAKWSNETLPMMMDAAERGDLRIEWRDVNQYGEFSTRATLAAHAAGLQGEFWLYHDRLFPNGEKLSPEQLTEESLIILAGELGLDTEQFTTDLNSPESLATILQYQQEGIQLGVSGTPAFILGGQPIVGAQPESVFIEALDQALAEAR